MKKNMLRGVIGIALTLSLSTPFVVAQAATKAPAKATSAKDVGGLKELIKLAKAEGELNTIALPDYWANYGNVIKAFEKKYGINARELLLELGRRKMIGGQEDMIEDTAINMARERGLLKV